MITVRSTINLAHQSVPNIIPVVQGDTGRAILFTLADFTIPEGATARYFVMKPSGLAVYNDATIDGNTVLVEPTAQSIIETGDNYGQVRISVGEDIVTSFDFILHVDPFRGIDAVESDAEVNIFDRALEQAQETVDTMVENAEQAIEDAAEAAEQYIAQAIDPTLTIEGKAADAKATGDAIGNLNSALTQFSTPINLVMNVLNATIGIVNSNYVLYPNDNERVIVFPVTSGETYTVYKDYVMPYARIAYCSIEPELNSVVTGYADFSSTEKYKTFTASQTGYACVKIHASSDAESASDAVSKSYVYEGSYVSTNNKNDVDLSNVREINNNHFRGIVSGVGQIPEIITSVEKINDYLDSFTEKASLDNGILNGGFSNTGSGYVILKNTAFIMLTFSVESGSTYTVVKGYSMPYARIAYSSIEPDYNSSVTGYADFSSTDNYKTFTASQTGYACVLIHSTQDSETFEQALASSFVYEGNYDSSIAKKDTALKNITTINGYNIEDSLKKADQFERVSVLGGFIQGGISNDTIVAGAAEALCVWFPVTEGAKYTLDKKIYSIYTRIGYTENVPKTGDTVTNYSILDNSAGCVHVTFTAMASGYATIFVANSTTELVDTIKGSAIVYEGDYIEDYTKDTYEINKNVPNATHVFYCGATRKLDTLVKGIEEAEKYMDSVLYVDPGVYDLVEELGSDYFDNATSTTYGIILKNRIHIIFSSNSKVVSNYDGNNEYAHSIYSPFNSGDYGFTLENLNLHCSNCRYAIHDEQRSKPEQFTAKYINCKMYIDNSDNPDWSSHHCIGGGLGANCEINIENCVFGNDDTEIRWGVGYHIPSATSVTSYRSVLIIKDCFFESGAITLQTVDNMSPSTSDNSEYIITNNSFSKKYPGTDAQGVYNTFTHSANVREWNNECRS